MDIKLVEKFFKGECTAEEKEQVLKWIQSHQAEKDISLLFEDFDEQQYPEKIDSEGILQKLNDHINMNQLIESLDYEYSKPVISKIDRSNEKVQIRKKTPAIYAFLIGFIILLLSGIYLYQVRFNDNLVAVSASPAVIEKSTGKGQKLTIFLTDGSKVILNAESKLTYYDNYGDSLRSLELTGEAFFEVAEDSLHTFIVKSGQLETMALGTSFNVKYNPETMSNEVALVTGKIRVTNQRSSSDPVLVEPGEMVVLSDNGLDKLNYDPMVVTGWKDGILYFNEASYQQVVAKLERWYGVRFETIGYPDETWQFTTTFENESLRNVLEALQYVQKMDYQLNNRYVTIRFD